MVMHHEFAKRWFPKDGVRRENQVDPWKPVDVPVGVPLDLSTPTGMSCIGTYGENCKSDNVSKYRVLLVAFLLLWHEKIMSRKIQ